MRTARHFGLALVAALAATAGMIVGPTASAASAGRVVWPTAASGVTYSTPTAAARGVALDLLGMETPLVSRLHGSATAGMVSIRPAAVSASTVVSVTRGATGWVVTGTAFADVHVTSPSAGARVGSTLTLAGRSTAFEAVVNFSVRTDSGRILAQGTVKGGANGTMAPFRASVHLAHASGGGEVILSTRSARDGSTLGATIIRVAF